MKEKSNIKKSDYSLLPKKQKEVNTLSELALYLLWPWNHSADKIRRQLDPNLWDITHSAWVVLQTISRDYFQSVIDNLVFKDKFYFTIKNN